MNGGMVSIANRIARYVDPQMRYTAANAARSLVRETELDGVIAGVRCQVSGVR
jgi:hypothetical protein